MDCELFTSGGDFLPVYTHQGSQISSVSLSITTKTFTTVHQHVLCASYQL